MNIQLCCNIIDLFKISDWRGTQHYCKLCLRKLKLGNWNYRKCCQMQKQKKHIPWKNKMQILELVHTKIVLMHSKNGKYSLNKVYNEIKKRVFLFTFFFWQMLVLQQFRTPTWCHRQLILKSDFFDVQLFMKEPTIH